MIDFFSYIALDFDRLVATFRTWWSLVRQFKVNNQLFVSNDTRTGFNTIHFKTESVTDGNDIIVLGEKGEKPQYSFYAWGSMMFTCGLAADILFYSFSEWVMYASDPHMKEMGSIQQWEGDYPLFHWSLIPWSFYLVLAVTFGFMLHVRKRNRQKY